MATTIVESSTPDYVQQFDAEPQFWQYLAGLTTNDLVTELLQNELDAGALHTKITFDVDRLTCQGDGTPVEEDGWGRLAYVVGAGDQVPAKRHQIGVKNHGLKACFTIGDDIYVRSASRSIRQTLYRHGTSESPSPGTYRRPVYDEGAPESGCLIEVPYRTGNLTVTKGEQFEWSPPTSESIDQLFLRACHDLPERLLGALRPQIRTSYVVDLCHHKLGTARFEFTCHRSRVAGNVKLYSRTCQVSGDAPNLPKDLHESCCLFTIALPRDAGIEVPEFYRTQNGYTLSEISWATVGNGRPSPTLGHRRYPISYGGSHNFATSGVGVHFSGPYASDAQRRGASTNLPINELIDNECKAMLIAQLQRNLIPRHGPKAMNILMTDPRNPDEDKLRDMVERTLAAGAFPIRPKPSAAGRRQRQAKSLKRPKLRFGPKHLTDSQGGRLILPVFTWEQHKVSSILATLCPSNEDQIDPAVPGPILRSMAAGGCSGYGENHLTFDEADVIARLQPEVFDGCYPWQDDEEWRVALSDPVAATSFLDVVLASIESGRSLDGPSVKKVQANAFLPNADTVATPLPDLYAPAALPAGLPIQGIPPLLHPAIGAHPLFRKRNWKRRSFTLLHYLDRAEIEDADTEVRTAFWRWLRSNWASVPRQAWKRVASLPVWPDASGELCSLASLCMPRDKQITSILRSVIRSPGPHTLNVGPVKKAKAGPLKIRTEPAKNEIAEFLELRFSEFDTIGPLSGSARKRFRAFETSVSRLASNDKIRKHLVELTESAAALSVSGHLRPVEELVRATEEVNELHLLQEDIIDRPECNLDRISGWQPTSDPSSDQILQALRQDPQGDAVQLLRLDAYVQAAIRERKDPVSEDIQNIECVPLNGKLIAPSDLAFTGSRGDYWGSWKQRITGTGLSSEVQSVYRRVGVLSRDPTPETSLAFFRWLNSQPADTLAIHLDPVIRHISHPNGPRAWGDENPSIPFIPVEVGTGVATLVSQSTASSARSNVVIPDFGALEHQIRQDNDPHHARLAIVSRPSITEPITSYLRQLRVKSLRAYAGEPIAVVGSEPREASGDILAVLEALRSRRLRRELRKRLEEVGLHADMFKLRPQWSDRLDQIRTIKVGNTIRATFNVGRRSYTVEVPSAYDSQTGILWLTGSGALLEDLFFEVAADRIFESPEKFLSSVLRDASRRELNEQDLFPARDRADGTFDDEEQEEEEEEPGGADRTHRGHRPDARKNLPNPRPVPTGVTGPGGHPGTPRRRGRSPGRQPSTSEDEQVEDLKQNQYAWHCQVCLAESSARRLAPPMSYVGIQENRSWIMRAHHTDQVHAGGARHAGNILILCQHHHLYVGDALSRHEISAALKDRAKGHDLVFTTHNGGATLKETVKGKLITIPLPLRKETVSLFFTDAHAEYWVTKASK